MEPNFPKQWLEHDAKVKPYVWNHRILSWSDSLLKLGLFLVLFLSWELERWSSIIESQTQNLWWQWVIFFGFLAFLSEALSLPFSIGHQVIEKRFHLSKQSWKSWWIDRMKSWLLGAVLGILALAIIFISVQFFLRWWFLAASLLILFSIILAQLTPVILIPIFFELEPMQEGELKDRLFKLCERFRVMVKDIYHLGLGEKTEKGNAAFVGIGRTKKIIIGDTLYKKFPPEQVEAVFAHELGHQVHNDLWKGILTSSLGLYLAFYLTNEACARWVWTSFQTSAQLPYGIFLFFIILSVIQIPFGIFQNTYTRHCERRADSFAHEKIGSGKELANALEKLTVQNFSYFCPHSLVEFLTYTHPAPWRRISYLRKY